MFVLRDDRFLRFFLTLFISLFFVPNSCLSLSRLKKWRSHGKKVFLSEKRGFKVSRKDDINPKSESLKFHEKELNEGIKKKTDGIKKKAAIIDKQQESFEWKRSEESKENTDQSRKKRKGEILKLYKKPDDVVEDGNKKEEFKTFDDTLDLTRKENAIEAKSNVIAFSGIKNPKIFKYYADIFVKGLSKEEAEEEIKKIPNYVTSSRNQKILKEMLKKHIESFDQRLKDYGYIKDIDIKKWMSEDVEKSKELEVPEEHFNLIKNRNKAIRDLDIAREELQIKEGEIKKINQEIEFLNMKLESAMEKGDVDFMFRIGDMIDDENKKLKVANEEREEAKRNIFKLSKELDESKKKFFEAGLGKETIKDLNNIKLSLEDLSPGGYLDAKKILSVLSSHFGIDPKISIKDKSEILKLYFDDSKYPGKTEREVVSDIRNKVALAYKTIEEKRKYIEEFESPKDIKKYIKAREKEIKIRSAEKRSFNREIKELDLMLDKGRNRLRNYENELNKLRLEINKHVKNYAGINIALKKSKRMKKSIKSLEQVIKNLNKDFDDSKSEEERREVNEEIKRRQEMLDEFYKEYSDFRNKFGINIFEKIKGKIDDRREKIEEEKRDIELIISTQDDDKFQVDVREKEIENLKEEVKDAKFYLKKIK